ncbi:LuxR C-terminal-related transcriptional regulator [Cellulosimicrobium arenosum]|uniref:HTH luxR-type domain-containing protein n=1 Tax=Cellulosimicrobium arenosum TaxID=2708133 RepID=A0A927PES9_9MICO|nr:LuxR C-terminal-related transcriptional regulator [Cellulosimicrobium arenosum]MBD8079580.1 hypothetical protein [Cellulosimicrobium arenosum]
MVSVEPGAEPEVARRSPVASGALRARTTIPVLTPSTVRRPALEHRLTASVARRLTLVSAGPGWGKTTAVAAWARSLPGPRIAWLTLELFDNTPTAFWSDLLAALRASGAVPPGHPLDAVSVPSRMSSELLRRILGGLELLPEPVVVVLDDYQHLVGADVSATVDDLLRYPLPVHLVLLSRLDPLLGLQRLRGQGEVVEIGAAELAFDAPAIASLGSRAGRTFDDGEVERLLDETGGWAVGVRLQVEAPPDLVGHARAERSAAEFLLGEVLDRQSPAARRFLLRTSLAATMCVELATAMAPGAPAGRLLPELAAANGFVTALGEEGVWYRYHPLLREMLRGELLLEDPAAVLEVHRAAAGWLVHHGEPLRALEHAVASKDWSLVGEVFVDGAAVHLVGPHRAAVAAVLGQVPYAELEPDVALHLCAAAIANVGDRYDAARHHLSRARALLADDGRAAASPSAVLLELLDASAARSLGDVRRLAAAAAAALAAVEAVPFPFPALETYRELALAHREAGLAWCATTGSPWGGTRRERVGVLGAGAAGTDDAVSAAQGLVDLGARAASALLDVAEGRLADGETSARAALDTVRPRGWDTQVQARTAHAAIVWARYLHAVDDGLDRALAHALAADAGGREPASEAAVRLLQSLVAASRGHGRAARHALAAADGALGPTAAPPVLADLWARAATELRLLERAVPGPGGRVASPTSRGDRDGLGSRAVTAVCRARILLADGMTGAALSALEGVPDGPGERADDLTAVEATLLEAAALARAGTRRADRVVARALDTAAPEQLARPFLTVSTPELCALVTRAVSRRDDALALRLRALLPRSGGALEPAPIVEPLTQRELSILAVLPTMESNVEIAEDFFVSVNTVKAHLKALYRKLDVGSRREAVRRGRDLGLLP